MIRETCCVEIVVTTTSKSQKAEKDSGLPRQDEACEDEEYMNSKCAVSRSTMILDQHRLARVFLRTTDAVGAPL